MVKTENLLLGIFAVIAMVAVGYIFFGTDDEPQQAQCPPGYALANGACYPIKTEGGGGGAAATPGQAGIVIQAVNAKDTDSHTGNINFKLKSSTAGTGITSKLLLLKKSEAVFTDGKFDEQATRYKVMRILANTGRSGLIGYDGNTPADNSVSSGTWAVSTSGKVDDEYLVFTYVDTSPAKAENASTAKIIKLDSWQEGTDTWSASVVGGGGSAEWTLYNYPYYDWVDLSNNPKKGYDQANSGNSGTPQTITWYGNASVEGEQLYDTSILVNSPTNFSGKMTKLVVSDNYGHSAELNSFKLASSSDISIAAGNVPAPTLNYNTYVLCGDFGCTLPDSLVSLRSSTDRNRLTFSMYTTTYDTQMNVTVYGLINAHAKRQADAFVFVSPFEIGLNTGTTSAYW